jgi:hypothetical protein
MDPIFRLTLEENGSPLSKPTGRRIRSRHAEGKIENSHVVLVEIIGTAKIQRLQAIVIHISSPSSGIFILELPPKP